MRKIFGIECNLMISKANRKKYFYQKYFSLYNFLFYIFLYLYILRLDTFLINHTSFPSF